MPTKKQKNICEVSPPKDNICQTKKVLCQGLCWVPTAWEILLGLRCQRPQPRWRGCSPSQGTRQWQDVVRQGAVSEKGVPCCFVAGFCRWGVWKTVINSVFGFGKNIFFGIFKTHYMFSLFLILWFSIVSMVFGIPEFYSPKGSKVNIKYIYHLSMANPFSVSYAWVCKKYVAWTILTQAEI